MYQLDQIGVYLLIYAGVVGLQFTVVERWLRSLGARQWITRIGLSLVHGALGYVVFLGILLLSNVVASGDYRRGWFDPYGLVIPVGGSIVGALLPWLPLLGGGNAAKK